MLTEKALFDMAWCPKLVREPTGHEKRVKQDQTDYLSLPLLEALSERTSNHHFIIEEDFLEGYVVYNKHSEEAFWFVVSVDDGGDIAGDLLLHVNRILMDDSSHVCFYRHCLYEFRDEDDEKTEKMCRLLLQQHFEKLLEEYEFPVSVEVITETVSGDTYSAGDADYSGEYFGAVRLARKYLELAAGDRNEPAKIARCPSCWWKQCPFRQRPIPLKAAGQSFLHFR